MKITTLSPTITKVVLSGRFDAHIAPSFVKEIDLDHIKPKSALIVDLKEVTFIDSTALAGLVRSMKRYRENQGELYIVNLQSSVRIIFELTRMDRAFSIYPSEEDALKAIDSEA
jgi:anti-sigma B factor antagonist